MSIVQLPQVGESVTEGIIGKWLKQEGDLVEEYEPLVEVVTDKVTMELPSPETGTLTRILAEEGAVVPMGMAIAEIDGSVSSSSKEAPSEAKSSVSKQPLKNTKDKDMAVQPKSSTIESELKKRTGTFLKDVRPPGPTGSLNLEATDMKEPPDHMPTHIKSAGNSSAIKPLHHTSGQRYSPVVKKIAAENNLDLALVQGTGIGGRVTKEDVLHFIQKDHSASGDAIAGKHDQEERVSLTPVRRMIASNMIKSATSIPHAWTMMSADLSNIVKVRNRLKEEFQALTGSPLTFLAFVLNSVGPLLKLHREFNASIDGNEIIYHPDVNIGIAVAAPTGLVVPVIHGVDRLSVTDLAKHIHALSTKAKDQSLAIEDVTGGTFTINNTGALGSESSFSIINYPQAAILNTEALINKVVAKDDSILIRPMMNISVSFDHRIVDGLQASLFLRDVVQTLEQFDIDASIT